MLDLVLGDGEIVGRKDGDVRQLAGLDLPLLAQLGREPAIGLGPQAECGLAVEAVGHGVEVQAAQCLSGDQPGQADPRIVARDARGIGSGADRHTGLQHLPDRRRGLRRARTVASDEIFALIGHAMLDGDAAA